MIQVGQRVKVWCSVKVTSSDQKRIDGLFDAVVTRVPTPVDSVEVEVFKDGNSFMRRVHPADIRGVKQ